MKLLIIGCGNMGSLFAKGLSSNRELKLYLYDSNGLKAKQIASELDCQYIEELNNATCEMDAVLLAVKPKDLTDAASAICQHLSKQCVILSILAGKTLQALSEAFPRNKIIRLMPNIGIGAGEGLIGVCCKSSDTAINGYSIQTLLTPLGTSIKLKEEQLDDFTALAASAPAFILAVLNSLVEAGKDQGFSLEEAKEIVLHMVKGTLAAYEKGSKTFYELINSICSPGGTTEEGMRVIERFKVEEAMQAAVKAASEKAKVL